MPDVLCIGNIQFDVLARPLVALPRPGTSARVEEIRFSLGGNGMNTAAGLAQLGIPTALFGMVSRDFLGDHALAQLAVAGVDTTAVARHSTAGSGVSLIAVPEEEFDSLGCNILTVRPGVVVVVDGNPSTRRALESRGCDVHAFAGREICLNGSGGPTCLTRPMLRG